MKRIVIIASSILAAAAAPVSAAGPVDGDWREVAVARSGDCALRVTGNGKVYRIAANGLEPGAEGRYVVTNGDMRPLDWQVRADDGGAFARYYLPFRWHRAGDTVAVFLDTPGCSVSATFDWERQGVVVR